MYIKISLLVFLASSTTDTFSGGRCYEIDHMFHVQKSEFFTRLVGIDSIETFR